MDGRISVSFGWTTMSTDTLHPAGSSTQLLDLKMNGPMFGGMGVGGGQAVDGADAQTMAAVKNVRLSCEKHPEGIFGGESSCACDLLRLWTYG
jgi:hypothetical protein